jgi:hypothetical protein
MSDIINIEVLFVGYLYSMDLITMSVSMKQTRLQVSSAYVNVFVMRLWVLHRIFDETVGVTGFVVRLGVTQDL